jgi:sensor domain CHASE-containing protein
MLSMSNMRLVVLGIVAFLVVTLVAYQFDMQQSQLHEMSVRTSTAERGEQLGAAVENKINKRLVLVQALAAFRKTHSTFSQAEFLTFASEVEAGQEGILSVQLAPDGIVQHVTRPDRSAKAIRHHLLADPDRSDARRPGPDGAQTFV